MEKKTRPCSDSFMDIDLSCLEVDDGTMTVYIPTPVGWKCERPGCGTDYMHGHSTYPSLTKQCQNQRNKRRSTSPSSSGSRRRA